MLSRGHCVTHRERRYIWSHPLTVTLHHIAPPQVLYEHFLCVRLRSVLCDQPESTVGPEYIHFPLSRILTQQTPVNVFIVEHARIEIVRVNIVLNEHGPSNVAQGIQSRSKRHEFWVHKNNLNPETLFSSHIPTPSVYLLHCCSTYRSRLIPFQSVMNPFYILDLLWVAIYIVRLIYDRDVAIAHVVAIPQVSELCMVAKVIRQH
mmetsp:Transcript_21430/g.87504  ORF Transcript_21430/g.87504 Transcript_21430/m.87504 type:complete len:205 (+) Transcript_21430:143-757(+)